MVKATAATAAIFNRGNSLNVNYTALHSNINRINNKQAMIGSALTHTHT